ncbi:PAS domain-containing sensor histidine kinase [Plantibacter sp. Mn2098]|uniref:PAS domain-containing sensor histidine kinase n=1 Tax=Plantibacter sp. Mn2098 TaxID=3395266 RepID=UPI003BDA1E62
MGRLIPTILSAAPQPIWVVDADGFVLYANPVALQTLGYAHAEEIVGHDSHTIMHGTRPDGTVYPASECRMLEPLRTGAPLSGEEWLRRTDGSFIPITWSSAPIELPGGRGAVHAFVDITERRQLEQETRERELAELRRIELHDAHIRLMENIASARSQIVRDLHDGAQQRLVALALQAGLLRESLSTPGDDILALLDGIAVDAQGAIDELRELASGIHPPVLSSRGLAAAVRAQSTHSPLPVSIAGNLGDRRLSMLIESNAYFFVAEALTNAAKHSQAGRIDVDLSIEVDMLTVTVADDGIGGVDLERSGTGLHSMIDRVQAFDGIVVIDSPIGGGTIIRARIPLAGGASQPPR